MTFFGPDIRNGLPIGLGSVAGFGRRAFSPSVLFAAGEQGFWYDPSDLSSMFQDSAGTTPVTAVEQAVGLILDKSRGLVLGPELATTTSFTGVAIGGPAVTTYDTGAVVVAGKTYELRATITGYTGSADVGFGSGAFGSLARATADGVYTWRVAAVASNNVVMFTRSTNTCNYSNISVRELAGNHAIQPGATNRPILRSRYNLLTYSEQFDNAAWTKTALNGAISANATTAPDGTLTADLYTEDSATAQRAILQTVAVLAGTYTQYVFAKNNGRRYISLYPQGAGTAWAIFDLQTGVVALTGGANIAGASITPQANGFYLCGVSVAVATAGNLLPHVYLTNTAGAPAPGYTGDGTSGVYLWGADLRRSSDTYLPYQRIAAATDYDTVGFPVYLAFDGSDDSLYTGGNVDFSATDKITLWAGVTKLSDAATGGLVELSAQADTNNGAFYLRAPNSASNTYDFLSRGTAFARVTPAGFSAPISNVVTCIADIGGDVAQIRVDGVLALTDTTDQGTGNYGSYPLFIGRRNNATVPFNGRLYQLIGRGAATSAALLSQADRWVAGKQGRAL